MLNTYAKDPDDNEIYTKDASGNEIIFMDRYAVKRTGESFYPRNTFGHEFHFQDQYILQNGNYILPKNKDGFPQYPIDSSKQQYYLLLNDKYQIDLDQDGEQHYAKDIHDDEFYTPHAVLGQNNNVTLNRHLFAKTADGTIKYAKKKNLKTRFPKDSQGNEYYLQRVDLKNLETIPTHYAKDKDGNDFYPKTITADDYESDIILTDSYAQNKLKESFYPKDAYNNEFYVSTTWLNDIKQPKRAVINDNVIKGSDPRYAVTNDLKVIVPNVLGHPKIDSTVKPAIQMLDIIGHLIREKTMPSDFLTNREYKYLPKPTAQKYQYIDIHDPLLILRMPPIKRPLSILKWLMNIWYVWVWFPHFSSLIGSIVL